LEQCNHGRHQVALNCKVTIDRHGTWQLYQDDPMPWTQLGKGVEVDASSTLKSAFDTSFCSINFYFEWVAKMFRAGLYYLLAGAAAPHVLSSVLQLTPPMGKSLSSSDLRTNPFQDSTTGPLLCADSTSPYSWKQHMPW
jgi:hypothetical protein